MFTDVLIRKIGSVMVIMEYEIDNLTGSLYFTHLTVIFMIMFSSLQ